MLNVALVGDTHLHRGGNYSSLKSQRPALLESLNCDANFSISSGVGGSITGLPIRVDIPASVALSLAIASWGDSVEWPVLLGFIIAPSLVCNNMHCLSCYLTEPSFFV